MATVTTLAGAGGAFSTAGRTPFVVDHIVDFAAAVTAKGGALAQADIIEALELPAQCQILSCGAEVIEAHAGTSTDLTLDIGITGGDVDCLLDGADVNGTAGTFTSSVAAAHGIGGTTGGYVTPNGGVTFSLLCNDALDAAQFRVTSLFMPIKGTLTSATDSSV